MARPCVCDKFDKGEPWIQGVHCRRCWLFHHDERYRAKWSEEKTISQKITNVTKSLFKAIGSFFEFVDNTKYQERLKICESCPMKKDGWKCLECGCYLLVKAKIASESCPIGKWPAFKQGKKCNCGGK